MLVIAQTALQFDVMMMLMFPTGNMTSHARIQKIFSGGVQIPRRGLTENFNMAKINNLAIPGGVPTPCPTPLDPPMRHNVNAT